MKMLEKLLMVGALFAATTAHAEDRWMSIPQAPDMPDCEALTSSPIVDLDQSRMPPRKEAHLFQARRP